MSNFRKTLASVRALKKKAELDSLDNYDNDYRDKFNQVTPYHIIFKDHGNEIASLTKEGAIQRCLEIIEELNKTYANDPQYHVASEQEISNLREAFEDRKVENGMDVLFVVKDALLESEGLELKAKRLRK